MIWLMSKALQLYHSDQICIAVKFNTNATSAITLGRPSEVLLLSFAKKKCEDCGFSGNVVDGEHICVLCRVCK